MSNQKLIRLIIYLVVSVAVLILLWNLSGSKDEKQTAKEKSNLSPQTKSNQSQGIPVELPNNHQTDRSQFVSVYIDSNHIFYLEGKKTEKDSLETALNKLLLEKAENERGLLLKVDNTVDSELTIFVFELANKNKWKVGIGSRK